MIPYAKASEVVYVGDRPVPTHDLEVIDLDTGSAVTEVVECNAAEGWLVRLMTDEHGKLIPGLSGPQSERVTGRYLIREIGEGRR